MSNKSTQPQQKVYISGKITGLDIHVAKQKFEEAAITVFKMGMVPVNPFALNHEGNTEWEHFMITDIVALIECDAIYMLPNWRESQGARIEHGIALNRKMPIYYRP